MLGFGFGFGFGLGLGLEAACWKRRGARALPFTRLDPSGMRTSVHAPTLARWARCLVFVSSQKSAEHVARKLQRAGYGLGFGSGLGLGLANGYAPMLRVKGLG